MIAYSGIFPKQNLLWVHNTPIGIVLNKKSELLITVANSTVIKTQVIDTGVDEFRSEYNGFAEILYTKSGELFTTNISISPSLDFNLGQIVKYPYGIPGLSSFKVLRTSSAIEVSLFSETKNLSRVNRHEGSLTSSPFYSADLSLPILETVSISPKYKGIVVTPSIESNTVELFRGIH